MSQKKDSNDPDSLRDRILYVLSAHPESTTQKNFEEELSDVPLPELLSVLNRMQREGMVEVMIHPDKSLSWRMREIGNLDKIKSLTDIEECLVYNSIRKSGNEGCSVKSISIDTKLPQNRLPRILKSLISKKLIKEVALMTGNKQKIYLLAEIEPSVTLAANTLFAGDSGIDAEFVAMLRTACLKYMHDKAEASNHILDPLLSRISASASVEEIHRFISNSRLCTVKLTDLDVKTVLDALMYGGELERKQSATMNEMSPESPNSFPFVYRIAPRNLNATSLAKVPCAICPVRNDCHIGGAICPSKCEYFSSFLDF